MENNKVKNDNLMNEEMESTQIEVSSTLTLDPALLKKTFKAIPKVEKNYGRESIVLAVKLHDHWLKKIELSDADQAFFQINGLDKEYNAKIGNLISRSKKHKGKAYIGVSVDVFENEVLNSSFEISEYKLLLILKMATKKEK